MKASKSSLRNVKVIPTGLPKLDDLLDGGIGMNRVAQFSGRSSVGKSTVAMGIVANAQKMGLDTLWLDTEHRFHFEKAEALGVNLSDLELEDKQYAEDLFDLAEKWVKKHKGLVILDSIGGLLTRKDAEKKSGEEGFPEAPRLIPGFLKRISHELADGGALVLLNHEKVDFASGAIKVLGGRAVEHHSDKWIRLRQLTSKKIMNGDKRIGDVIEASVQKGAKKGLTCELHLLAGQGFHKDFDLAEEAVARGIITKNGNTFSFGEEKLAVGMGKLRDALKQNELAERIKAAITNLI